MNPVVHETNDKIPSLIIIPILKRKTLICEYVRETQKVIDAIANIVSKANEFHSDVIENEIIAKKDVHIYYLSICQKRTSSDRLKEQLAHLNDLFTKSVQCLKEQTHEEINLYADKIKKDLQKFLATDDLQDELKKIEREMRSLLEDIRTPPFFMINENLFTINYLKSAGQLEHFINSNWGARNDLINTVKKLGYKAQQIGEENSEVAASLDPIKNLYNEIFELYNFDRELWLYNYNRSRGIEIKMFLNRASLMASDNPRIDTERRQYLLHVIYMHLNTTPDPSPFELLCKKENVSLERFCQAYSDQVLIPTLKEALYSEYENYFVSGIFFECLQNFETDVTIERFVERFQAQLQKQNICEELIDRDTFEILYSRTKGQGQRVFDPLYFPKEIDIKGQLSTLIDAFKSGNWPENETKMVFTQKLSQQTLDQICRNTEIFSKLDSVKEAWSKLVYPKPVIVVPKENPVVKPIQRPAQRKVRWFDDYNSN